MSVGLRIGIVGGGVMGLSCARALARRGDEVTLWSAADLGAGGASEVPVALLNPFRGRTGRAHPDDHAALEATWRWASELRSEGLDPGAEPSGVLRIADGPRQAQAFASVPGLRTWAPTDAPAPFRAPHGGALGAAGGWLDPRRWTAALARSAHQSGAVLRAQTPVAAIDRTGDGTWRVVGANGAASRHDRLLLATGAAAWPARWSRTLPAPAFTRHAGDVVITGLPAPALPLAGGVYLGPVATPTGVVAAVGGHHRPPGPPAGDAAIRLRMALAWAWPDLAADTAANPFGHRLWWGVRAHGVGNRPQLLELAPDAWWVGGLAGRGFLAAALQAEAAAERVSR